MVSLTKGRSKSCKSSIGGVNEVYLFPFVNYSRSQIVYSDLVLTSFPETIVYKFETVNQPEFRNTQQEEDGGKFYAESLNLEFAKPTIADEFEKLLYKDFRCIVRDRNGLYRMLGAFNGITCESLQYTTGEAKNSLNGVSFSFEGKEERPALFINNLFDSGIIITGLYNYVFEDGINFIFEDGINFKFN